MGDNENRTIFSENPDIDLFAEDFMNHILLRYQLPLLSSGIADHRSTLHNAFTPQVRLAADSTFNRLRDEVFEEFKNIVTARSENISLLEEFRNYRLRLRRVAQALSVRPEAKKLIEFCVRISTMAAEFRRIGFEQVPRVAVGYIGRVINGIELEREEVWGALNEVAADYSQRPTDMETDDPVPEGPSSCCDSSSSDSPPAGCRTDLDPSGFPCPGSSMIAGNSKASDSPDPSGTKGGDGQSESSDELSRNDFCPLCLDAMSSGGPFATSYKCEHVEKTVDVVGRNLEGIIFDDTSEISLGVRDDKDSSSSHQSAELTSSEEDSSRPKVRVRRKKRPSSASSCSTDAVEDAFDRLDATLQEVNYTCCEVGHSTKEPSSDSSSPADQLVPENLMQCDEPAVDGQVVDENSAILRPAVNDLLTSDSMQTSEESTSDNRIDEDEITYSTEEEDKANTSGAKSCPPRKPDQK